MDFSVTNEGDYASQCVPALQFGNPGNFNNAPTFLRYASREGDEPRGRRLRARRHRVRDGARGGGRLRLDGAAVVRGKRVI